MVFLAVEEGELQCVCVWPGFPLSDKQCAIQLENKYNKNYKNTPLQLQIVTGRTFRGWISRSHPQEIKQLRESLNSSRILFEAACQVIILSHYQVLSKNFFARIKSFSRFRFILPSLAPRKTRGKKIHFHYKNPGNYQSWFVRSRLTSKKPLTTHGRVADLPPVGQLSSFKGFFGKEIMQL